jgi:maltose O-acetyltransferase
VKIYNSNFHSINPNKRKNNEINNSSDINIGDNVFIGSNAIILKGTKIGNNSIIGAGAIISGVYEDNLIITGSRNNYHIEKIKNDNN